MCDAMEIGTEKEKEIYVDVPTEIPAEPQREAIPAPVTPAEKPVEVPATP